MACSGRGSGMKTEWVRWMGPEPGGRAHAERPDAVRTSHAAKPRKERPLGRGCGEDGGRRLHTDRGARVCDMAVPRGRGRPSSLAAGCTLRNRRWEPECGCSATEYVGLLVGGGLSAPQAQSP